MGEPMTATHSEVPWPPAATSVSDWADVGTLDEFRSFDGPKWTVPNLEWNSGEKDPTVLIYGTQLRGGMVEGRCIRVDGFHWDDMLSSDNARTLARALLEAADCLDRLGAGRLR
jgi:hypothetical protein